jgi:predicted dehydrogenase
MTRTPRTLGVGIIGAGSIARGAHQPGFAAQPDVETIAAADPLEGRAAEFARDFDIPHAYTDYRDLLARDDIDVVSVATPPFAHAEATIAALEAGKHVFCEKPMAMNAAEAQTMADAADKAGRVLAIDFQTRFSRDARRAHELVAGGRLGQPHFARATMLRQAGVPTWGTFTSKSANGGGALIDIGVHALDRALYVLGHPEPLSVWGSVGRPFGNRGGVTNRWGSWDTASYDVDDYAFAGIRFEGDLILLLECSWILRIGQSVERLAVSAADGGLEISPLRVFHDRDGFHSTETYDTSGETRKEHEMSVADFVHAVRTGGQPTVTARQGVTVTRIVDAIYQSAAERTEVPLT